MRVTVPGYVHRRGVHCGSAAMRNMLAFRGIELSEALCFGLGSGAGFLYLPRHPVPPGTAFHGRTLSLEADLCAALSLPFPETPEPDADSGWEKARSAVAAGHPALINTDIAFLDYFDTRTHFSGHRVVLMGFDDERGEAILSDSERAEPQVVPVDSLKRSRSSTVPPFPMENRWCVIVPQGPPRRLAEAVPEALSKNARGILAPPEGSLEGIAGMRRAAQDLPRWTEITAEWPFAARFGYQIIEKRGTGGGLFRGLYARYLEEAGEIVPAVAAARLAEEMAALAERWTKIAAVFKRISESKDPAGFREVRELFLRVADAEERFWRRAAGVVS